MEELIKEFIQVGDYDGDGYGSGYGDGSGDGYGDGYGYGSGDGDGDGYGDGYGYGSGYGSGYGYGSGSGYGSGYGYGIKSYNEDKIYSIDNIPTIITSVRNNVAKGYIVQSDLTLTPCFAVKENNMFAHGKTLREAFQSLQEKLYDNSTEEERLAKFRENFKEFSAKYPARELFVWHHILTGSCKAGREAFCRDRQIDLDNDMFTVFEFVEMTKDSYNGNIILKLIE
ncbi:MAG: hypothetical protein ACI4TD_11910 [Phocaeicola sp.]